MEIILNNDNTYNLVIKDVSQITWDDYFNFCTFQKGQYTQDKTAPFLFSQDDIDHMVKITRDEQKFRMFKDFFPKVKEIILSDNKEIVLQNKYEALIVHKLVWFFQHKLVYASEKSPIVFTSQDFANFDYDLVKLSQYYKKNGNLEIKDEKGNPKRAFFMASKEKFLRGQPNLHYCEIKFASERIAEYTLAFPLPAVYKIE